MWNAGGGGLNAANRRLGRADREPVPAAAGSRDAAAANDASSRARRAISPIRLKSANSRGRAHSDGSRKIAVSVPAPYYKSTECNESCLIVRSLNLATYVIISNTINDTKLKTKCKHRRQKPRYVGHTFQYLLLYALHIFTKKNDIWLS